MKIMLSMICMSVYAKQLSRYLVRQANRIGWIQTVLIQQSASLIHLWVIYTYNMVINETNNVYNNKNEHTQTNNYLIITKYTTTTFSLSHNILLHFYLLLRFFISSGTYIVNINELKTRQVNTLNQVVLGCQTSWKENANIQLYLGDDTFIM